MKSKNLIGLYEGDTELRTLSSQCGYSSLKSCLNDNGWWYMSRSELVAEFKRQLEESGTHIENSFGIMIPAVNGNRDETLTGLADPMHY